jgi:hypothetical protein
MNKCSKRTFPRRDHAENALANAWMSMRGQRMPQRVYQCKQCSMWHLTSKPLMTRQQLAELHQSPHRGMA